MSKPITRISPDKLKDKSHLLYKIQQKHEHWGVAKCALLIGAGCSYPTLPLGGGLIKYCQQLCYIRDVFPAEAAELEKSFLETANASLLNNFIKQKAKNKSNSKLTFQKYISEKEKILLKRIRDKKEESIKKIPSFFGGIVWDDFEIHFLNDAKYGFWMDAYNSSPRERQRLIEALIEKCTPSGAYIILALLIEKGYLNNILTTNFDDFINDTLLYYTSSRPRFYADDELSQYISIYSSKPNIIKLHGDYRYANIKNTNEETLKLTNSMEDKLRELLQNLDLIVIGYNGADYSIMNVLQQVKTPNCELLWCALDENNVHWRVASLINNTPNSWFIKIKGFDDIIKDFYLELVKSPPNLIEKARIRQDEIGLYISQYNKVLQERADTPGEKEHLKRKQAIWELNNKAIEEKDPNKKLELANKILDLDKDNSFAYLLRGSAFFLMKEYKKSINEYNEAIKMDQRVWTYYNNRGLSYKFLNEYEKAIADYTKAMELQKDQGVTYSNRGACYNDLKEYQNALTDLKKAIELDKDHPNAHKHIAQTYYQLNDLDNSLLEINTAIELNPNYIEAYELRVLINKALGKKVEVLKDEKKIKELVTSSHT